MGSRNTAANNVSQRHVVNTPNDVGFSQSTAPDDWYRNPAWLALPTLTVTDQRVVGLVPVFSTTDGTGNYIAFSASGNYTVDWGDGTTENFVGGATAGHNYNYNSAPLVGTECPFTVTAATNTINRTAHGYKDGQKIMLGSVSAATGLYGNTPYWVCNATADTFQLCSNSGALTPLTIAADGTGNLLPYRQVIISVTPQSGNSLSSINFNVKHPLQVVSPIPSMNWLDVSVAGTNMGTITLGALTMNVAYRMLEQFSLIKSSQSNFSYFFNTCNALRSVPTFSVVPYTTTQGGWNYMFKDCKSLVTAPWLNMTGQNGDLTQMFGGCSALRNVPLYDLSSVTITSSMFTGCSSLKSVPAFNLKSVTACVSMFSGCAALATVPAFDLRSTTSTAQMFNNCAGLRTVPSFKLTNCLNTASMFSGCTNLRYVGTVDLPAATTLSSMFASCVSLERAPIINAPNANAIDSLFSSCTVMSYVPPESVSFPKATNVQTMFVNCNSLRELPPVNLPMCASLLSAFTNMTYLQRLVIKSLASNVNSINSAFVNCSNLVSIKMPALTSACTNFGSAFSGCNSLVEFPQIDASGVTGTTGINGTFTNCLQMPSMAFMTTLPSFSFTIGPGGTMPVAAIQDIIDRLPIVGVTQTLTTTNCSPDRIAISTTGTWLASAKSITVANATGIVVGQRVVAGGISTYTAATSITVDVGTSTFTKTGHGFAQGTSVAFNSISTVTGIASRVRYYMVNVTADTFQVSETQGGAAITLGGSGTTVSITWPTFVTAVNGTTITLSDYPTADRSNYAVTFQNFDPFLGNIRNWNVF